VFQWLDGDGTRHDVKSADANEFLREISGEEFTAKDFRTWAGTLCAYPFLTACPPPSDESEAARSCLAALDAVAEKLKNTRAVARSGYVHEGVLDLYSRGALARAGNARQNRSTKRGVATEERELLRQLRRWRSSSERTGRN
jgi:DNA topoisomerase-1